MIQKKIDTRPNKDILKMSNLLHTLNLLENEKNHKDPIQIHET